MPIFYLEPTGRNDAKIERPLNSSVPTLPHTAATHVASTQVPTDNDFLLPPYNYRGLPLWTQTLN